MISSRASAVLAAAVLGAAVAGCAASGRAEGEEAAGWLELPGADGGLEPMLPFTLEATADAIALGRSGEPLERRGESWIRLDVEEVLSGALAPGGTQAPDEMPFFGCMPPPELPRPSEMYPPGSAAVLYLQGSPGAWRILALMPVGSDDLEPVRERILLFLRASDPDTAGELLREPLAPLPQPVFWALTHHPTTPSRELVAAHLPPLVEAVCGGRSEAQGWLVERLRVIGAVASGSLARAWPCLAPRFQAQALDALSHELDPAPEHTALRARLLAELDRDRVQERVGEMPSTVAGPSGRSAVVSQLVEYRVLEAATVRALGRLAGAEIVERLRRALSRREGQRAVEVVQALGRACTLEPVEPCRDVRRDLLALVAAATADDPDEDGEMTLLRYAIRTLLETFGDEDTRTRLQGHVTAAPGSWVASEIEPYL